MAASSEGDSELVDRDDYYAWLGLSKYATQDEINLSFRRLSRMFHPDKHAADATRREKAQHTFAKIKKAHEILSDEHQRAIYDTTGIEGLETSGWQVVSRTKTAHEILQEYEDLAKEREERRLQQRTHPTGTVSVGLDATDIFDEESTSDNSTGMPRVEMTTMSISQSVECPLTSQDTLVISGSLQSRHGTSTGTVNTTLRRVLSHNTCIEGDLTLGKHIQAAFGGFTVLWPRSQSPGCVSSSQGRLSWRIGSQNSLMAQVNWHRQQHHLMCALQLGFSSSSVFMLNYSREFAEHEAKFKSTLRVGMFGAILEYGCEKKVSQFSILGASMLVGVPIGVMLRIKLNRGSHNYVFPIQLADSILPSAIFYGTLVPIVAFVAVRELLVRPFLKQQHDKELQKKKEVNLERMQQKREDAANAVELMSATVQRSYEVEQSCGGLVISKALYGKLHGNDLHDTEYINVTRPLQALVHNSKLCLPHGTQLSELPGFYDPCLGEPKQLSVAYEFRRQSHLCRLHEHDKILIPSRNHILESLADDHLED